MLFCNFLQENICLTILKLNLKLVNFIRLFIFENKNFWNVNTGYICIIPIGFFFLRSKVWLLSLNNRVWCTMTRYKSQAGEIPPIMIEFSIQRLIYKTQLLWLAEK